MNGRDRGGVSGVAMLQFSAWAGIFVFGIVMAVLGAILPSLFDRIGFSEGAAGNLFLNMNLAMLLMTVCFGPLVDRFGFKSLLAVSALLVAAALLLLSQASSYGLIIAAAVVLGLGGGGLNGGANALTSDLNEGKERGAALNILGIFFGIGALTVPFLIGALRGLQGVQAILPIATTASLVLFVIFIVLRFPKAKQPLGFPIKEAAKIGRSPLLWLCAFILFFQSGNEFTAGGWISTYLLKTHGLGAGAAALVLGAYWAAIMSGRLASSRIVRRVRNETLILGSAALALAAAALMVLAPSGPAAATGAVALGFGFAAIYPTTLAIVGGRFSAFTGTAFSVVIAVGLVGGMLAPWLAGKIAQASSLRQGLVILVVNCAMIVVLTALASIQMKKETRERSAQ